MANKPKAPFREDFLDVKTGKPTKAWMDFFRDLEKSSELNTNPSLFYGPTELTLNSFGEVTVTGSTFFRYHKIDTLDGADEGTLLKINGGNIGEVLIIQPEDDARTIVVESSADIVNGNNRDFNMNNALDKMLLICTASGVWEEITRISPGS